MLVYPDMIVSVGFCESIIFVLLERRDRQFRNTDKTMCCGVASLLIQNSHQRSSRRRSSRRGFFSLQVTADFSSQARLHSIDIRYEARIANPHTTVLAYNNIVT